MQRADLDYHDYASMKLHANWDAFIASMHNAGDYDASLMFAMITYGSTPFASLQFRPGDIFVFGSETRDLEPNTVQIFCAVTTHPITHAAKPGSV